MFQADGLHLPLFPEVVDDGLASALPLPEAITPAIL